MPTHVAPYTAAAGANVNDLNITLTGASVSSGDRLLFTVCADGNNAAATPPIRYDSNIGADAGFTSIGSSTQSCTVYAYHKQAGANDAGAPTYNFKMAAGVEKMIISVIHIQDDDGIDGTPAFTQNVGDTTPESPTVTTTAANALVYHFLGIKTAGATIDTPPAGETLIFNVLDGGSGGIRFACYRTTQATAGATGAVTWTISAANDSVGYTVAAKALASGGATNSQTINLGIKLGL